MYAQLCKRLSEEAPTFEKDATSSSSSCTFLRLLIAVCRDKFNNRLKRDITENDVNNQFNKVHRPGAAAAAAAAASSGSASTDGDADEEERRHLAKQRMLGNVKFIGELNKLDMLSKNVLHQCIMELLDKKKKRTASAQEMCEDMECLAQLLKTCGKNLDSEQGKELMNQYFDTLERRSKSSDYPPRIRFLLKDVIELRENAWVPRKVGGPTEPVPIKQIRTDDDGQIMRTPFAQQRRGDMRHSDRDGDNWMNRFHLNLQPSGGGFSDMFGSLSVTGASPMMSPFASNSTGRPYNNDRRDRGGGGGQGNYQGNRYNNNKHQQNGGGGGPGGGGGMRDDMRSHQNRDRDSRDSQYGGGGGGRDGGGRDGGGRGGDMGSGGHNSMGKELAPRFKRNLMTPNQDSVENLQMRPGANSLLFKAASQNQKIPTTLPISTPPSGGGLFASSAHQQQKQKDQQLNSQYPLLSTPTSHLGGGGGASSGGPAGRSSTPSGEYDAGGHNNNAGGKQQQTDSGFKAVTANEMNSLNNRKASGSSDSNSVGGDKRLAAGSQGGAKANGPAAGQAMNVTKHGSLEKLKPAAAPAPGGKQDKKKDKAFNKEEVLKKTAAYIKERFYYTEQEEEEEELAAQRAAEPIEPKVVEVEPEAPEATEEEKPATEEQGEVPAEVPEAVAPETVEPVSEAAEKAEVVAAVPAEVAYDKSLSRLLNKVVDGFVELKVPEKCMKDVCLNMLMDIVEKADEKFIERSVLFLQAVLKRISVKANVIVEVFKQVVNKMNEREALNPRIATHVASLLCRAVHQVGLIKLTDVAAYTDNGQHYPLFLLVLQQLHKAVGKSVLEEMFTASKIDLMNNLPEVDRNKTRLGEILDDRNLAFLYPLLKVQAEMQKQLSADPSPSAFYKWIKANVEPKYYKNAGFITSLMTVLLRHITSDTSLAEGCDIKKHPEKPIIEKEQNQLLKYAQLLQTFLANNTELQLIAIYALQVFCYEENFPKGMLCRWFKYLYEAEVIEEESFILWKEEISDKYPGKGSALFQVNNWLTWLQEAESEDDED